MPRQFRPVVIVEAPSNLGLKPPAPGREPGTRRAPDVLRSLGLHDALVPRRVARVEAAPYAADRDRAVNVRNMAAIAEHALRLADAVEAAIREDAFPLVLGGDCSILLGSLLGLGRVAEPAVLFVDGHTDFFLPSQSATGGAAGMDLALAAGWGPPELSGLAGRRPLVEPRRIAALGNRDDAARPQAPIPALAEVAACYMPLAALRERGVEASVAAAAGTLAGATCWVHLDVDAIDSTLMPAVDSPQPDGLDWVETEALLRAALANGARGLQVTIYDPDRDPELKAGRRLADVLAKVLTTA